VYRKKKNKPDKSEKNYIDNYKKILSDESKLKLLSEMIKKLLTTQEMKNKNKQSEEKIKDEIITFINELL
jgi:hypothetical protein